MQVRARLRPRAQRMPVEARVNPRSPRPRDEARKPFPVTDADLDAPDGERIYDPEHGGWFERVGANWNPCEPPVGHLCIDIADGAPR